MENCYSKGTLILFCTKYSAISTNVYGTLKIEEILHLAIFVRFSFFNYVILGGIF